MSDYKIGYGNPPKDFRFKAGNNANPKGRPKRKPLALARIMRDFEGQLSRYTESGRTKTARRQDLISKKIVNDAVKGDVKSAEMLLSLLQHLMKNGDAGSRTIRIRNWLPDRPGQTAEEKTQDFATDGAADPPEWWRKAEDDPEQDGP
jgi:Family of unknown function (DUF5681)